MAEEKMLKPTVYTAFDGDQMTYIDCMREIAIKNGFVPVNPEHALGYYLSTRSHGDSKAEVMRDCLSLTTACDAFWVFADGEDIPLEVLPEGILIEILLWVRQKNSSVSFFSIAKTVEYLRDERYNRVLPGYSGKERPITERDLQIVLNDRHYVEISTFLRNTVPVLRPLVYVDMRDEDFKYADWARHAAFLSGEVPIVPQYLIPKPVYALNGKLEHYPESLERLKDVSSGIWAVYESQERLEALQASYKGNRKTVTFIPIKNLNVPKYANPRNWSITSKEAEETLRHTEI